jgi:cellobiose dehydrogenase (acceptor)
MTISQYLGRATSRGRMTITPSLTTIVSDVPYLKDANDKEAIIQGLVNVQNALKTIPGLVWQQPSANVTAKQYIDDVRTPHPPPQPALTPALQMVVSYSNRRANHWCGTNKMGKDDGRRNGTAVVDTNTKVYGTDNLFVVDASIFPGVVTTNPSAYIVTVAEHAAQKILKLKANAAIPRWGQCGGKQWEGSFTCAAPYKCEVVNEWYSQCL